MNFKKFFLSLLLLLSLCSSSAFAQEEEYFKNLEQATTTVNGTSTVPVTTGGFFQNLQGVTNTLSNKNISGLGQSMFEKAVGIAAGLNSTALQLAGALALVYFCYEVLQFMAGRSPSITQALFDVAIPAIFAAYFINTYDARIVELKHLLSVFSTLQPYNSDPNFVPPTPLTDIFALYANVLSAVGESFKQLVTLKGSYMQGLFGFGQMGALIVDGIASVVFLIVIIILIVSGSAEVFGLVLLGPFLFAVGVAFGPLMIAGLVTPWTNEYFKKWLIFLTISSALSGVVAVILKIASIIIAGLHPEAMPAGQPSAVSLIVISIILLTINSLISQAPGITSSLFPGSLGGAKGSAGHAAAAANGAKNAVKSAANIHKAAADRIRTIAGSKGGGKSAAPPPTP